MRCPKDANYTKLLAPEQIFHPSLCNQKNEYIDPRYFSICTRPKGHLGLHHAHDSDNICVAVWGKDKKQVQHYN